MNHAVSIADFALKLREKLRDINADLNTNYQMKIGQSSQIKRYKWTCKPLYNAGTYVNLTLYEKTTVLLSK